MGNSKPPRRIGRRGEVALFPATVSRKQDTDRDWLARAMSELPVEQRAALELAYLYGHSCEEIAAIMDLNLKIAIPPLSIKKEIRQGTWVASVRENKFKNDFNSCGNKSINNGV